MTIGSGPSAIRLLSLRHTLALWSLVGLAWLINAAVDARLSLGPTHGAWAAAIPWIVSGVSALASMYSGSKSAKAQNKVAGQQGELIGLQKDAANRLMPWGEGLMKKGGDSLSSLLPWYTKAAFGDRTVLEQLMRPELQQIRQNYDVPLQQLTELSPRTGTTAAGNAAILAGRATAKNNAILGARMAGMQGLQGLAGQLAGLGSGAVGASFGGLQGASASASGLANNLFNLRNQNNADSEAIGASLADFLKQYQTWQAGRQAAPGGAPGTPRPV